MEKVKFNNERYISRGVDEKIGIDLQRLLWGLIDELDDNRDYLQCFYISTTNFKGENMLKIEHKQENPEYLKTYYFFSCLNVNEKIFIIDDDTHSTMLIAEEY